MPRRRKRRQQDQETRHADRPIPPPQVKSSWRDHMPPGPSLEDLFREDHPPPEYLPEDRRRKSE